MNDLEIIEKKNYLAKQDAQLDFSISPEDSKAVYLKKLDEAGASAKQLGDLSLTDDDGQVVATTVAQKKDLTAQAEAQAVEEKIRQSKLADAKLKGEAEDDQDFGGGLSSDQLSEDEVVQMKEKKALISEEQPWWQRDPIAHLEKVWDGIHSK